MDSSPIESMSSNTNQKFITSVAAGQTHVLRRSRLETSMDILRAIGAGAQRPTHIMYKANLSWVVMQEYMINLEQRGLVASVSDKEKREYGLTQKGFELLGHINSIRDDLTLGPNA